MNISLQQKRELVEELIIEFKSTDYSRERKQELLDQTRAKLQFIKPESIPEIMKAIQGGARIRILGSSAAQQLEDETQWFEGMKERAISQFKGLLTEIDLIRKFTDDKSSLTSPKNLEKSKVFIVHGHDEGLKIEVARFVERLGLIAVILHEQPNRGKTIIEKFERFSDVGFAIVLYTPCDVGKAVSAEKSQPRARQNVVFEHGYFVSKLGRENVVALTRGEVEIPNDLSGVIYASYEKDNWERDIAHELNDSGYDIDFSKV